MMALAKWGLDYQGELRADFRRFYQLNWDERRRWQPSYIYDLIRFLPQESTFEQSRNPSLFWSQESHLLKQVEYDLRCLLWSMGGGKGKKPEPINLEAPKSKEKKLDTRKQMSKTRQYLDSLWNFKMS